MLNRLTMIDTARGATMIKAWGFKTFPPTKKM
jgi:hypothetical protein